MTLRTVALLIFIFFTTATCWAQTPSLPLPVQPAEPRENRELRISDDATSCRVITQGTSEHQLQALLGTPTLASTIPTTHETRLVYQDGTEILLAGGRVIAVVLGRDAQSDFSGGHSITHDGRQTFVDPAVVHNADHLLVSAAASPGIEADYLHFGHPAYRSTTFPVALGKGPYDVQWSSFADLPPDPSLANCDPCLAEHAPPEVRFLRLDVGVRTWLSYAQAKESSGAVIDVLSEMRFVDVLSELKWRNMVSEVFEINARARWFERFITRLDIGIGDVSGGRFRDQDFAVSGRQGLFSDTIHPAFDDDLFFANVELGWRFVEHPMVSLDALFGYQHWRERYVAQGGVDVFPTGRDFPPGSVITEEFSWDGFRVGLEGVWYATPHWTFNSRLMLMPLPHLELVDIHHLRSDLRKDPSFIARADGGIGVMADILATYTLWDGLLLEIGYRLWHVNSSDGEIIGRPINGEESKFLFNGAEMTRHGLVLGLSLNF